MTTFARRLICGFLLLAAGLSGAQAQVPGPMPAVPGDAREAVTRRFPEIKAETLVPSPIQGLYEVRVGSRIAYVSGDGRYLIQGEIIDLDTEANLTEKRRESLRRELLGTLSESDMVVFSPPKPRHTVTVFTDIDCGYCRKLHRQIAAYNGLGIKVRYVAFPRSGPGTESWHKAEQVWCSRDRRDALTRAKAGEKLDQKICQPNPVAKQYQTGRDFAIQGTPAIITDEGELIGGYLDPAELLKYLEEGKAASL